MFKRSFLAKFKRRYPNLFAASQVTFVLAGILLTLVVTLAFNVSIVSMMNLSKDGTLLFSMLMSAVVFLPAMMAISYKVVNLDDKLDAPEKAFRADLSKKVDAQFSPLFPLLHQNRALWAALERVLTDAPFTATSGWRVDVTKQPNGLRVAVWAPKDTAEFAGFLLSKHNDEIAVDFDTAGRLTSDDGQGVSFRPESLNAALPHVQEALVQALRAHGDGASTAAPPVLNAADFAFLHPAAMPGLVQAVQNLRHDLAPLLDLDPSLGFSTTAQKLSGDLDRLGRIAGRHALDGAYAQFLEDFLLPRLAESLTALPAVVDAGALSSFQTPFEGLARHVGRVVDDLHRAVADDTTAKTANALRVADIVAPAPMLVAEQVPA